jgi:hypothetical protein
MIWKIINCRDNKPEVIQSRIYTEMMTWQGTCNTNMFFSFGSRIHKTEGPQDRSPAKHYSYFVYDIVLTVELTQLQMKWVLCKDLKGTEGKVKLSL